METRFKLDQENFILKALNTIEQTPNPGIPTFYLINDLADPVASIELEISDTFKCNPKLIYRNGCSKPIPHSDQPYDKILPTEDRPRALAKDLVNFAEQEGLRFHQVVWPCLLTRGNIP